MPLLDNAGNAGPANQCVRTAFGMIDDRVCPRRVDGRTQRSGNARMVHQQDVNPVAQYGKMVEEIGGLVDLTVTGERNSSGSMD